MSRAELILYATPSGPLADAIDEQFRRLAANGGTTAQEYPPHCTLTGFFHREEDEIPRIGEEVETTLARVGDVPADPVEILALRRGDDWVGLELSSPWLRDVTDRFVASHRLTADDDPLRPKDWLHLSLAYGTGDIAGAAAETTLDLGLDVAWEVALWRRLPGHRWRRISTPSTTSEGRHG